MRPASAMEPPPAEATRDAIAKRGLEELDRLGWDRCTVVADEFGVGTAVALASQRPEAVAGLALGHACLSHRLEGDRPPINPSVYEAFIQTGRNNFRTFARHLTQVSRGGYDDELADRWVRRVPTEVALSYYDGVTSAEQPFGELLEELDVPLLFGKHEGCIMFTPEGFADAVSSVSASENGVRRGKAHRQRGIRRGSALILRSPRDALSSLSQARDKRQFEPRLCLVHWHQRPVLGLERSGCRPESRVVIGHERRGSLVRGLDQVAGGCAVADGHTGCRVEDLGLRQCR